MFRHADERGPQLAHRPRPGLAADQLCGLVQAATPGCRRNGSASAGRLAARADGTGRPGPGQGMDYPEEAKPVGSSGGEVRPPRMVSSPLTSDLAGPVVAALARSAEGVPVVERHRG